MSQHINEKDEKSSASSLNHHHHHQQQQQGHLEQSNSGQSADSEAQAVKQDSSTTDFSHGFWDRELAGMRKAYLIGIARVVLAISVLIWAIVTIYWGSLWKSNAKSPNLTAMVLNRDSGAIGTNLTNAFLSTNNLPPPHLTWISGDVSKYPTTESVEYATAVDEVAWVIVEVLSDATAQLAAAQSSANASWNPTSVISVYYSEARNQQSVDGIVLNAVRGVMTPVLAEINTAVVAQFLAANSGNAAALTAIATSAPQTISGPVSFSYINLRPWKDSVAIAPTFVGLIYAMILAFNVTMANFGLRQGLQRKLRYRSLVMMRIFVPMVAYIVISCMFSMINIPFKLPFGGMGLTRDPYGAGFMIWWCFTFLGMSVLGLCTEIFLSLVGPQFIGFALVFFIIINVSVANVPIELQVSLFKYGYSMPFYNLRQSYITIIYNTGKHIILLKYMGILLAWLAVIFLTFPIWIWMERRQAQKAPASQGPPGPPGGR